MKYLKYKQARSGKTLVSAIAIAACCSVTNVQLVNAQEQGRQNKAKNVVLEEIIVTAEKREQSLQEVPVAISAFTADMLEMRGIEAPQDLQLVVPGLMIAEQNTTGGTARATIRGVGNENYQPGGDPGVPIHINGHYTQSTAYVFRDMIDVERVEVQRGPQGTLYGRNAVGGNINIITKRPTTEFEGSIGVDVGNYNKHQIQAVISGPLSDSLRGRLVLADAKRDGFVKDVSNNGDDRNTANYTSIRAAVEADVVDNVQLYLNAYYFNDTGNTYVRRLNTDPNNISNTEPFEVRTNTPNEDSDESKGLSIDISWDLGEVEFRSLSAYDDTFKTATLDTDYSDSRSREFGFEIGYETVTQEFQLVSTNDSPLQWVTGLFYYKEKSDLLWDFKLDTFDTNSNGSTVFTGDFTDPRFIIQMPSEINAESMAIYGQIDFDLSEQLEIVSGLRYTKDEKDRFMTRTHALENGGPFSIGALTAPDSFTVFDNSDGEKWDEVTGKFGLNFHANEDVMLYISYSRGYKAGGYNAGQDETYDPEYVDALEAGVKSQWLDNRVQTNLAIFYYDYTDKQDFQRFPPTPAFPNGAFQLLNAAKATSYGAELEFQAYINDAFFIDGSIAYLNAEFDEFNSIDVIFPALGFQDLSGNKLPLSPEWKFNIGMQYEWALNENLGTLSIRGDYVWVDDQYGNGFNREGAALLGDGDLIPSYHIANARLQWESTNSAWLAELYVRNLTDEVAFSNAFVSSAIDVSVTHLAPRTYGLKLSHRF